MQRLLPLIMSLVLGCACVPSGEPQSPARARVDLGASLAAALAAEATDPLAAGPYLDTIDAALAQPGDRWALAAVLAATDALVWRDVDVLGSGVDHAIVHRSNEALVEVGTRLRSAWNAGGGGVLPRGIVATALHDLALRVGAGKAAARWRRRAGCVPMAAVAGPLASPPLVALSQASPVPAHAALPASFPGVAPFAKRARLETVYGDACLLDVDQPSALRGLKALIVDIDNPEEQDLFFAATSSSAMRLEIGGKPLLERSFAAGGEPVTRFAVAHAAAGRVRLVALVASNHDGENIALQMWDQQGEPLPTRAPRPGDDAPAEVSATRAIDVLAEPSAGHLAVAMAGLLAAGEARRAAQLVEARLDSIGGEPGPVDLLRLRALSSARSIPPNQLTMKLQGLAEQALGRCPDCWEAKLFGARAAQERKGYGTGIYARFSALGVDAGAQWRERLGLMELLYVARGADEADLGDVARVAYDELARRAPGSLTLADLDWALYRRSGAEEVQAACGGGTNRSTSRCVHAHLARSDLKAARAEMESLRRMRGSPAVLRDLEMRQLLLHGDTPAAMLIYQALPPGRRDLALLGAELGTPAQPSAADQFLADMLWTRAAPHVYEPLGRLLGALPDPSAPLEAEGALLIEQDRRQAFLPGAGTAVLRRLERYQLGSTGLLSFLVYDLRRVSGTVDVASGTWLGIPLVDGQVSTRFLRRRIHKKDGRVLDPDPSAQGLQGETDLSQLETGDYVEALLVGWALPGEDGQLVVDTPDLLPERTSVRDGLVSLTRPRELPLDLWSHSLLGAGASREQGEMRITEWRLRDRSPRRMEEGVPPLEARVGISFGTDSWQRIASAIADRFQSLDEADPWMDRWVAELLADGDAPAAELTAEKKVAKIVAAVGKAVRQSDPSTLSDFVASLGGGPQRETARWIVERGSGSRSWVVHRALRALGLTNRIAVAETRPFSAAPGFPARPGRFSHPLVRVELEGEPVWLDVDVNGPPLPPGRVSPELRGRQALLDSGELVTVEASSEVDVDEIDVRLTLDETGDAHGTFTAILHGAPAQQLAQALEVVVGSDRDQLLRNVVLGWLPFADVREVTLSSDEGSWQFSLRAEIDIVGFARPESRKAPIFGLAGMEPIHVVYPRPGAETLASRYGGQAGRTTALAIDRPQLYHLRRRIELPPNAKGVKLPAPLEVTSAELVASRKSEQAGNVLTEDFRLNLPVGTVDVASFDAFLEAVQRVDDGFRHGIVVELEKP